jgi:hypothetical protein
MATPEYPRTGIFPHPAKLMLLILLGLPSAIFGKTEGDKPALYV